MSKYVEFEKQADGKLHIVLLGDAHEDVQEIASKQMTADSRLAEVLEWQLSNGWALLLPEDIGALTDAPLLSEEVDYADDGTAHNVGTVYWYPQYEVFDPVEQLLKDGFLDFERTK